MDILQKITRYREEEEKLKWEGTFAEYLKILKEKPWVAQSAHSRVYNMIKDAGVEEVNGRKRYKFLASTCSGLRRRLSGSLRNISTRRRSGLMCGNGFCC